MAEPSWVEAIDKNTKKVGGRAGKEVGFIDWMLRISVQPKLRFGRRSNYGVHGFDQPQRYLWTYRAQVREECK